MDWVLDASMALAWAFPDEKSSEADRFLGMLTTESILWVPAVWWYEMANALTTARHRQRLTEAEVMRLTELYGMLPYKD